MIGPVEATMRVLQMNLCNSGRADCYTGRAVSMAATLIRQHRPQMISVNEVCRDDMGVLERAMSPTFRAGMVASAFAPARDRHSLTPVRCDDGQEFGDGLLVVLPSPAAGSRSYSGVYPVQDAGDTEERVWVCIGVAGRFSTCTTHASSTNRTVALDQCRYLLGPVVSGIRRADAADTIIVGADLNLVDRGSPSSQSCLPSGYQGTDDASLQDVVVSPGVHVSSLVVIDMHGTTDHPGLLVDLALPPR